MRTFSLHTQTLFNSLGSAILLGFQWLISVCLVRINGYKDAGVFSLAMTIANVFSTIANYGLRNYQITDQKRLTQQHEYLLMRIASSLIAFVGCNFYLYFFTNYIAYERQSVILYLLYNLSIAISDVVHGSVQLKGHLECNGISNIIRGILSFALFLGVLLFTGKLIPALAMMALGSLLVLLVYDFRCYKKYCRDNTETIHECAKGASKLFVEGFPIMVAALIPMMITAYPRTTIRQLLGAELLGYFSSVYTPAVILSTMIPPALIALLPAVSKNWIEWDTRGLRKGILIEYGIVVCLVAIAYLGGALFGRFFLKLLYGESVLPHVGLLKYAILAVGMSCICTCGSNIMVAIGGKAALIVMSLLALLITWCFSGQMVLSTGIKGAALIQLLAYGTQAIAQAIYLIVRINRRKMLCRRNKESNGNT